jgi:hypothetical protein
MHATLTNASAVLFDSGPTLSRQQVSLLHAGQPDRLPNTCPARCALSNDLPYGALGHHEPVELDP